MTPEQIRILAECDFKTRRVLILAEALHNVIALRGWSTVFDHKLTRAVIDHLIKEAMADSTDPKYHALARRTLRGLYRMTQFEDQD